MICRPSAKNARGKLNIEHVPGLMRNEAHRCSKISRNGVIVVVRKEEARGDAEGYVHRHEQQRNGEDTIKRGTPIIRS